MDALTFGTKVLLRHLNFSEARKMPIKEFHLDRILEGLNMNHEEFMDLCILLGCDYCDKIRGVGPKNALKLVQEHKNIENIIKNVDKKKHVVPENWLYQEARRLVIQIYLVIFFQILKFLFFCRINFTIFLFSLSNLFHEVFLKFRLFKDPEVEDGENIEMKWEKPDEEGLVEFMCKEKNFAEDRIRKGAKKLADARQVKPQGRLDSFFKVLPSTPNANGTNKRKSEDGMYDL